MQKKPSIITGFSLKNPYIKVKKKLIDSKDFKVSKKLSNEPENSSLSKKEFKNIFANNAELEIYESMTTSGLRFHSSSNLKDSKSNPLLKKSSHMINCFVASDPIVENMDSSQLRHSYSNRHKSRPISPMMNSTRSIRLGKNDTKLMELKSSLNETESRLQSREGPRIDRKFATFKKYEKFWETHFRTIQTSIKRSAEHSIFNREIQNRVKSEVKNSIDFANRMRTMRWTEKLREPDCQKFDFPNNYSFVRNNSVVQEIKSNHELSSYMKTIPNDYKGLFQRSLNFNSLKIEGTSKFEKEKMHVVELLKTRGFE